MFEMFNFNLFKTDYFSIDPFNKYSVFSPFNLASPLHPIHNKRDNKREEPEVYLENQNTEIEDILEELNEENLEDVPNYEYIKSESEDEQTTDSNNDESLFENHENISETKEDLVSAIKQLIIAIVFAILVLLFFPFV